VHVDGLGHVVVEAGFEHLFAVALDGVGGQRHGRGGGGRSEAGRVAQQGQGFRAA
jgi:hypothetical protein